MTTQPKDPANPTWEELEKIAEDACAAGESRFTGLYQAGRASMAGEMAELQKAHAEHCDDLNARILVHYESILKEQRHKRACQARAEERNDECNRIQRAMNTTASERDNYRARAEKAEAELERVRLHAHQRGETVLAQERELARLRDDPSADGTAEANPPVCAPEPPGFETAPRLTKGVRYRVVDSRNSKSGGRSAHRVGKEFVADGDEVSRGSDGWYYWGTIFGHRVVRVEPEKCERCGGTRRVRNSLLESFDCPDCDGTGEKGGDQ